jgi:hypothetical protein
MDGCRCEPDYGIFVPANKVSKAGSGYRGDPEPVKRHNSKPVINYGKVRLMLVMMVRVARLFR